MASQFTTIQNSLSAGELTPGIRGRTDVEKWHHGCTTARNFFANYKGGMSSRAGLAYVGTCKQTYPNPPRDIPFQFSLNQGFVLEFGDHYMRVKSDGAYIIETAKTVNSVGPSAVFDVTGHGFSVGDWVFDVGNDGFSGLTWIVNTTPTVDTFTVKDLFGTVISSATTSTGGTVARIYTVDSPYAVADLPYLKYVQSADVMTLTLVNTATSTEYIPYNLARLANDNWTFTAESFGSGTTAPTGLTATGYSSDVASTWYSYVITTVSDTGEESVPSLPVSVQNNDISVSQGSNYISWPSVAGASYYNIYAATPSYGFSVPVSSLFGFVGTSLGTAFTDTNVIPDFTRVPPQHLDPFVRGGIDQVNATAPGINYDQSTIGYTITTSTGSGFSGTPVVSNAGGLSGFVIYNHGKNYAAGDTIAFTDSGGGHATGTVTFSANPADTNVVKFNGVQLNFSISTTFPVSSVWVYTRIGSTLALTLQSLANTLNSSNILALSVATYTSDATHLYVKYKTPGTVGNAYTLDPATAPCSVSGATLSGGGTVGSGATGTLTVGPVTHTYPSVVAYFQQRRVYANSLNQPDTYWMSQPGRYNNMDSSIPVTAGDSITGTPWAQQVNGIQWLVPMPGGLVVLTGKGAWQVNGGQSAAITPSNQNATPQAYNGCNALVPPIVVNYDILYVQSKGSIMRDLAYNFFTNIYTGTDLTVLSSHLFTGFSLYQAAYCEEPYKLIWCTRNDGTLLCLTYLKEQEVSAWTRHDTNGFFVSVCSVTEPPIDALYVITQRYVQGAWRYYSERMDDRIWENVEDSFCVDAGLTNTPDTLNSVLYPMATTGTGVLFKTATGVFSSGDVGRIIRADGGKAVVTAFNNSSQVTCTILERLTDVVTNDPDEMPAPVSAGFWTITTPFTEVTGLNHLEGLEVSILADGSVVPNQTVTDNKIILDFPASKIVVGLPFLGQVQTMYLDAPSQSGTIQNKRKAINSVGVRVEGTRGLTVGADQPDAADQQNFANIPWTNMNEIKERTNQVQAGSAIPLFTGDYFKNVNAGWSVTGQVAFEQAYPLPANILSTIVYWTSGDDG